jgi:hypothetical protein
MGLSLTEQIAGDFRHRTFDTAKLFAAVTCCVETDEEVPPPKFFPSFKDLNSTFTVKFASICLHNFMSFARDLMFPWQRKFGLRSCTKQFVRIA